MAGVDDDVRSGPSRRPAVLQFQNQSSRRVNVIWIDYKGQQRNYGTLDPGRNFDIHTYEGHPWISEDASFKTRMLLNNLKMFIPVSDDHYMSYMREDDRRYLPFRSRIEDEIGDDAIWRGLFKWNKQIVVITLPVVIPLWEKCAETIARNIRSSDDIDALFLPKAFKQIIRSKFHG